MSPQRTILPGGHLVRITARLARRRYARLAAAGYGMGDIEARARCREIGIGPYSDLRVEKARNERAKWVVVAIG